MKHSIRIAAIAALSTAFIATPASAAPAKAAEAKERPAKSTDSGKAKPQKLVIEHSSGAGAALAQFDTDGDGVISDTEKTAAGERYKRVTEAMARRADGSQQHADRMAKRDDMKASKEAGPEARPEAVAALKADKEATRESMKSGEMTKGEAKAAKKDQKKWWQFWKSGS